MRRFFIVVKTLLSVHYAFMLEYRAELILWMLAGSLPIILMGIWIQAAESGQLLWTPLPYILHFPVTLLLGWPEDLGRSFLATLVWIGIFFCCNRLLWRRGLRRYSGMGA